MDNTLSTDAGLPGLEEMIEIAIIKLVAKVWVSLLIVSECFLRTVQMLVKRSGGRRG